MRTCTALLILTQAMSTAVFGRGIGDPCSGIDPYSGQALLFDGVNDRVQVPDNTALTVEQQMTIEFWMYPTNAGSPVARPLMKGDGAGCDSSWSFAVNYTRASGRLDIDVFLGPPGQCIWYSIAAIDVVPIGAWSHVAFTLNTTAPTGRLYVNGLLVDERNVLVNGEPIPPLPIRDSPAPLFIGGSPDNSCCWFAGVLDELRIWNVARTQSQIQGTMHESLQNPTPGLVAYYRFDEGDGLTTIDSAGPNNGTLIGSTWVPTTGGPDCNSNNRPDSCDIADGTSADLDGNTVPDECDCWADIDGSGTVNVSDLLLVIALWGPCSGPPSPCDLVDIAPPAGDGQVNVSDLLAVIGGWGACP